jgi:tRNA (guanine37-N1)-methyltransferase
MTEAPKKPWSASVLTLFPEMFPGTLGGGVVGQALDKVWCLETTALRTFGSGKHQSVDDTPYGGGAGMVMKADVIAGAMNNFFREGLAIDKRPCYYLSPRGEVFNQQLAKRLSLGDGVILLCGRYEGVDQRALDTLGFQELSIGDYVLAGGELAAQVVIEACVRLLPGVTGNADTHLEESFHNGAWLEYPHYTRPAVWRGIPVPEVLLSGHHQAIKDWRQEQAKHLTKERRPDLWARYIEDL